MRSITKLAPLCAALVAIGMAGPAFASDRDDDGYRGGGGYGKQRQCRHGGRKGHMGHHRKGRGHGAMRGGMMKGRIDGRLAFVKAELKITDAQTAAWDQFAGVFKTLAETRKAMKEQRREERKEAREDDGDKENKTLLERLEQREARVSMRLDHIKAKREGLAKLYDVLDDDQKKTAEEVIPMMLRVGVGRGGRHAMMRHGMMRGDRKGHGKMHRGGMGRGMGMGPGEGRGPGPGMEPDAAEAETDPEKTDGK